MRLALHWQILIAMVLGATGGLLLNATVSTANRDISDDFVPADARSRGVVSLEFRDSTDRTEILVQYADRPEQRYVVDGTRQEPGALATLKELKAKHPEVHGWFQRYGRSTARWVGDASQKLGGLFLRLLQMVAIPLIIASLITGVLGLGDAQRLGKMFGRTLLYYVSTSFLAIVTGLCLVNLVRPGLNSKIAKVADAAAQAPVRLGDVLFGQLETLIPTNPIQAAANGSFLSIISFSLAFAIFTL